MHDCFFASDLHLFASRSWGHRHLEAILQRAATAEQFVLGGDIFDFKWSRATSLEHSVTAAIAWLDALTRRSPNCQFYYVLGNHDCIGPFVDALAQWSATVSNFHWDPHFVRLGCALFLHGDVADRVMNPQALLTAREHWATHRQCRPALHQLYGLVVSARLHAPIPRLVYPKRVIARRILSYLDEVGQGPESGVEHVYFGHTHRAFTDYAYGGLRFHTGGAPMPGLRFQILEAITSAATSA